jgi:protein SCO1/2
MSKENLRIFGLLLVIGAPVFFFLVFKPLSKIPRPLAPPHYYPIGATSKVNDAHETEIDSIYQTVGNDTFTTQSGDPLVLDSLRGNIYVADFFFATCPGICPTLTRHLDTVQKYFIKDPNFRLVSFTVDPDRDSIPVLREYAKNHGSVTGRWFFCRAPKQKVYKLANESFHLIAKEDQDGGPEAFIHSEKLVLVDYNGVIRGYYNGVDSNSVNKLMQDIVLVLRETERTYSFRKDPNQEGVFHRIKRWFTGDKKKK